MKYITILLMALFLSNCASNKYDAEIAKAKFEYGHKINAQKKIFELKCDQEQKDTGKCGIFGEFAVYQPNQGYVDVDPQKKGFMDYSFGLAQALLPSVLQYAIADSSNKYAFKSLESTNSLFSGIFSDMSNLQGTGITYADSNYDYSSTSNVTTTTSDSNNSADYSYSDSYNTSSGDTLSDSYNTSSSQKTRTETSTSSTQGDTTSTNTTSTTTTIPEEVVP